MIACAAALRPGGVFAVDLCDLRYGEARRDDPNHGRVEDGWAIVTRFDLPRPNLFVREMTTFVREDDGSWRRDDERHENVLLDTARIPASSPRTASTSAWRSPSATSRTPKASSPSSAAGRRR